MQPALKWPQRMDLQIANSEMLLVYYIRNTNMKHFAVL